MELISLKRKSKRKYTKKASKNEFAEIIELKLNHVPAISKDDITDFQIDLGLYNKTLEKNLAEDKKKDKPKGKKKCVKKSKRISRKVIVKKRIHTCKSIKKDSEFKILSTV